MSNLGLKTGILLYMISYISALAVNNSIRLYGGSSNNNTEGVVQVFVEDEWKAICNGGWDAVDALVTCRQLGFIDGYAMIWTEAYSFRQMSDWWYYSTSAPPTNRFPMEGNDFKCNGDEEYLLSCKYKKFAGKYCSTLAGVACGISRVKYNDLLAYFIRWNQGDSDRLSYTVNGISDGQILSTSRAHFDNMQLGGGVCDMDDRAAMLICKNQGYINGGKKSKEPAIEGLPMFISKLSCSDDDSLSVCDHLLTSTGICPNGIQFNGVKCYNTVATSRSIIGALVFAGLASIIIIIAGACGIHWIKKDPKIQHFTLSTSESGADEDTSSPSQSDI